jgi:hypothetical protein
MKKIIVTGLLVSFLLGIGFVQATTAMSKTMPAGSKAVMANVMTYQGTIIDNRCAGSHKKDLGAFVKTHTKECTLMPGCVASGYSLYMNGKLMAFDKESNSKIEKFLNEKSSKLDVVVTAQKENKMLKLLTIKNQ